MVEYQARSVGSEMWRYDNILRKTRRLGFSVPVPASSSHHRCRLIIGGGVKAEQSY